MLNTLLYQKNRLLALLPEEEWHSLREGFSLTTLPRKKVLYERQQPIDVVYFPLTCVVSVVAGAGDGNEIEVASIGNDGVVGVFSVFHGHKAVGRNTVQLPGDALCLNIRRFKQHFQESARFSKLIHKYVFALVHQIMQIHACNRLHTMQKRCARWLLMTHDRVGADTFDLTQQLLAEMLGVRRATVNLTISTLKTAGFIQYARGQMTVKNRSGLESIACQCYDLIRREYEEIGVS